MVWGCPPIKLGRIRCRSNVLQYLTLLTRECGFENRDHLVMTWFALPCTRDMDMDFSMDTVQSDVAFTSS